MPCFGPGCSDGTIMDAIAGVWVPFFHATFRNKAVVDAENSAIRMSINQQQLIDLRETLEVQEQGMSQRIEELSREAFRRKQRGDVQGAKRKLMERRR